MNTKKIIQPSIIIFVLVFLQQQEGVTEYLRPLAMKEKRAITSLTSIERMSSKQELAVQYGKFYSKLIDIILGAGMLEEKQSRVQDLFSAIPESISAIYPHMSDSFHEVLQNSEGEMEQHRGQEREFLLEHCVRQALKGESDEITAILEEAAQKSICHHLYTGIYALEVDYVSFQKIAGLLGYPAHWVGGIAFLSDRRDEPSFLMIHKHVDDSAISNLSALDHTRHEACHIIGYLFERANLFVRVDEENADLAEAYGHFRSEFMAHNFVGRNIMEITPYELVYSKDQSILAAAQYNRNFVGLCVQLAAKKGTSPINFLLGGAQSKNFDSLKDSCIQLTAFSDLTPKDVIDVFYTYRLEENLREVLVEIVNRTKMRISSDDIKEYVYEQISKSKIYNLNNLRDVLNTYIAFAREVFGFDLNADDMLYAICAIKMPWLTENTIRFLMTLPQVVASAVSLDKTSLDDFVMSFCEHSFFGLEGTVTADSYHNILRNCLDIQMAFNFQLERIIAQSAESYRIEMRNCLSQEELEEAIRLRVAVLRSWSTLGVDNLRKEFPPCDI